MSPSFKQTINIAAPAGLVWDSLTQARFMTEWMGEPGMEIGIETDWTVGGPIVVRGFHHLAFENIGVVLEFDLNKRLTYTYLSSLSQLPDEPENYTTLEFSLDSLGDTTSLSLVVDGFPTETIFKHLQFYWGGTLEVLKRYVESRSSDKNRSGSIDISA